MVTLLVLLCYRRALQKRASDARLGVVRKETAKKRRGVLLSTRDNESCPPVVEGRVEHGGRRAGNKRNIWSLGGQWDCT